MGELFSGRYIGQEVCFIGGSFLEKSAYKETAKRRKSRDGL